MFTDEQLMQSYLETGSEAAFARLYKRHVALVRRIVARQLFQSSDVEDLVQHTFMQLHAARHSYRVGEPVRPWLCVIAVNSCRDYRRRRSRRPETLTDLEQLGPCEPQTAPQELKASRALAVEALDMLSERARRIFREHFLEDRALVDIARDLGEKPSTVRVRLHRSCAQLRLELAC